MHHSCIVATYQVDLIHFFPSVIKLEEIVTVSELAPGLTREMEKIGLFLKKERTR